MLALRDEETIEKLGAEVSEALQNVVRNSTSYHPIVVGRVVFYLMSLLHASYVGVNASFRLHRLTKVYRIILL
jgi:brefeldin A-resistance guanine nucleotide exchange factor 1